MAFRFRKFEVYTDIKSFIHLVFSLTGKFPSQLRYTLGTQINSAVFSVLLNFAEGSDRGSDNQFAHFIDISIGSLNEVVGGFDIALIENAVSNREFDNVLDQAEIIVKRLSSLKRTIKNSR